MKRIFSKCKLMLLVAVLLTSLLPVTAFAEATQHDIATVEELQAAVAAINETGGEHVINLLADISGVSMSFNKADTAVTIVGNGHTVQMNTRSPISIINGVVLNLGDGSSTLTVKGTKYNDDPGLVAVHQNCTLNMYDGVTLSDNQSSNYHGGGVTMQGGTFNMYGGTIENCGINGGSNCFGGGVSVNSGGLFNMYGGTIKDCYANTTYVTGNPGLIPSGAGGGVVVFKGSTFNLIGGTITGCSASESGGGVAVIASRDSYRDHNSFGFVDSEFKMTGGSITNNTAGILGGGIFVSGYYAQIYSIGVDPYAPGHPTNPGMTITGGSITGNKAESGGGIIELTLDSSLANSISDGVLLCNNIASYDGSDLYLSDCTMKVPAAAAMSSVNYTNADPSDVTGRPIGAWYKDYNPADDGTRYVKMAPADRKDALVADGSQLVADDSGDVALIAAPGNSCTVTFKPSAHSTLTGADENGNVVVTVPKGTEWNSQWIPTVNYDTGYGADESAWTPAFAEKVNDNLVYTATEKLKVHSITYKITGDYFANDSFKTVENVPCGTELTQITDDMTKEGYTFSGWTGLPATMPDEDVTVTGSYSINSYTLTIHYVYPDGSEAAPDHVEQVAYGARYSVDSPEKDGYTTKLPLICGNMPAKDVEETVPYVADPISVELGSGRDEMPWVLKELEGRLPIFFRETFTVELSKAKEEAPAGTVVPRSLALAETPETVIGTVTMTKTGEGVFVFENEEDLLTFDEAGTYRFTVKEVAGKTRTMKYDQNEYTLVITVTEDHDIGLVAAADAVTVTNTYRRAGSSTTVETTPTDSPTTADAGIAVYGMLSVMSLLGTGLVIGKKKAF